jgi:hypothetical protein
MKIRYLVLDQNQMRSDRAPEVVELLKNSPEVHFIVPDAALIEMTKNSSTRESTLRNSLEILTTHPDRVHVTYNTSECLRTELAIGVSTTNCLLYPAASKFLRSVLRALKDQTANRAALNKILSDRKHHAALARDFLNHSSNKRRIGTLIDSLKDELTTDQIKKLRAGRVSQDDRLNMIRTAAPVMLSNTLRSRYKMSHAAISNLIMQKPMLLRYHYLKMWLCLEWVRLGGFESKPEAHITNDLLDHEYILTALSFDGLISKDEKVTRGYNELHLLVTAPVIQPVLVGD